MTRLVVQMGTCDGERAAAAAMRLVDDVAGNKFFLNIIYRHLLSKSKQPKNIVLSFETWLWLNNRDRREHGLSQRLQLEGRYGSCIAHTAWKGEQTWNILVDQIFKIQVQKVLTKFFRCGTSLQSLWLRSAREFQWPARSDFFQTGRSIFKSNQRRGVFSFTKS